jgi:hypothetical protein
MKNKKSIQKIRWKMKTTAGEHIANRENTTYIKKIYHRKTKIEQK